MKGDRLAVVLVAVAAVVVVMAIGRGDADSGERDRQGGSAGALEVGFVYSPEKEELIKPLIDEFNASGTEVDGAPVLVRGAVIASGEAERRIAAGRLQPVSWSPASSLWGRLLNRQADQQLVADNAPSIVRTPLVIAIWEPMARALGWPDRPLGFEDILRLARAKDGWGAVGHSEFGDFKLVHTNPEFSTSGLSAVVAEYYAATDKTEGLVEADIDGAARATVRAIERSIVHYGDTTLFVADQMRADGPDYASAVAMEEATLLDFNRDRAGQPKLVAIYPREGTFYSDNPFYVLAGESVTPQQGAGAEAFQRFLADRITPEVAAEAGFRPPDPEEEPLPPISPENGADPAQPVETLSMPSAPVLAAIRKAWRADRKPANVMITVDVSGSMGDADRLPKAIEGLHAFLDEFQSRDRVGLTTFNERVDELVPIAPFRDNERALRRSVVGLTAAGGTAFLDATSQSVGRVQESAGKGERINAVVVLSDGEDTDSATSLSGLLRELSTQNPGSQVRVFTIAYSAEAAGAAEALMAIAESSGGQYYDGGTDEITRLFRSISSFF